VTEPRPGKVGGESCGRARLEGGGGGGGRGGQAGGAGQHGVWGDNTLLEHVPKKGEKVKWGKRGGKVKAPQRTIETPKKKQTTTKGCG